MEMFGDRLDMPLRKHDMATMLNALQESYTNAAARESCPDTVLSPLRLGLCSRSL